MTVQPKRKDITVAEYYQMADAGIIKSEDRVELINGEIITMSPIYSPHASVVDTLLELLILKLHSRAIIRCQNPLHLDQRSEPEPDIVIAHYQEDSYQSHHPIPKDVYIVIEVSDSTLQKDRKVKIPLYAKAGIPEYWIINLQDRQIEIHRQPKNGEYHSIQIISKEAEIKSEVISFTLNYSDIFK